MYPTRVAADAGFLLPAIDPGVTAPPRIEIESFAQIVRSSPCAMRYGVPARGFSSEHMGGEKIATRCMDDMPCMQVHASAAMSPVFLECPYSLAFSTPTRLRSIPPANAIAVGA